MVQAVTTNRNRTAADVRSTFAKGGGNLGESGCVAWNFETRGVIALEISDEERAEELGLLAIDAGAADISIEAETPGTLGQQVIPLERAGCYAPGGRFPLPSSVLMTAIPARVAGVTSVTVASPRPAPISLAAAAVAGADRLLAVGGAQAIAAMAFGVGVDPVDVIVGPGNRWVTAAKQLVSGSVRIDMLAGPSELVVIADDSAAPAVVAADLLAQAEHDTDSAAILASSSRSLIDRTISQLASHLADLPTAATARAALANGFAVLTDSNADSAEIADRLAPEHLQIITEDASALAASIRHAGAIFIGAHTAEVFGDYGLGPNHTLPTGGTARSFAGLSVFDFLRIRTTIELTESPSAQTVESIARLARLEGLAAHARAAELRLRCRLVPPFPRYTVPT